MHRDYGKMENLTSGKGWAYGYERVTHASYPPPPTPRRKRRFDVRDLIRKGGK